MNSRILVVEEDSQMRARLVEVLRGAGWCVETAANGQSALALVASKPYEAVVTNVVMTGMDGLDALARIKSRYPWLGSVVVSPSRTEELLTRALRAGAGDFLKRPFTPDDLVQAVQRQLQLNKGQKGDSQSHLYRKTLLHSISAIALTIDQTGAPGRPLPGLHALGLLARQLAASQELPPSVCEELQLATWIQAISDLPGESPLVIDYEELPASIQQLLLDVTTSEPPLESRILALVLALGRGDDVTVKGRFDPELVEQVRGGTKPTQTEPWQKRAMLSRARSLHNSQQVNEAIGLYEQVLKADPNSPDGIECTLALMRLRNRNEMANQAVQVAQRIGPWQNAQTSFEVGIALAEMKASNAEVSLQRSTRLYRDLDSAHRQALSALAQEKFSASPLAADLVRTAVEALGNHFPEPELLSANLNWLAPWLLAYPALEEVPQALRLVEKWLKEDSEQLASELGGWNEKSRLGLARALRALAQVPGEKVLKLLQSDSSSEVRGLVAGIVAGPGLPPALRIHSLGPLEVYQGPRRLPGNAWRTQRARHLFAYLVAHGQEAHPQEALYDRFMPEEPTPERLVQVLEALRLSLRPKGWPDVNYIKVEKGTVRLNLELPLWHDLEQLENSYKEAQRLEGNEAADLYRRIVTLARGPVLEDFAYPWVVPIRERVQEKVFSALFWLANWAHQSGRPAEAVEHASRLVESDPLRQDAAVLIMDSLVALNRIEEALRFFERCKAQSGVTEGLQTAQKRAIAALTY